MKALVFEAAEVRRVVEHALNAPGWSPEVVGYMNDGALITRPGKPGVMLVHDDGVYLMSNGEPRDFPDPPTTAFVAYARGCNPRTDPDFYETARRLVGGEDFGETFPWAEDIKEMLDQGAEVIVIGVSDGKIKLLRGPA